mmetsp:Transcript_23597/g.67781  ORF Transcript_23597/g.67781 Transcript_23597/m.67781 type:complete len:283 (-) Transcript_23597:1008-1856(-)
MTSSVTLTAPTHTPKLTTSLPSSFPTASIVSFLAADHPIRRRIDSMSVLLLLSFGSSDVSSLKVIGSTGIFAARSCLAISLSIRVFPPREKRVTTVGPTLKGPLSLALRRAVMLAGVAVTPITFWPMYLAGSRRCPSPLSTTSRFVSRSADGSMSWLTGMRSSAVIVNGNPPLSSACAPSRLTRAAGSRLALCAARNTDGVLALPSDGIRCMNEVVLAAQRIQRSTTRAARHTRAAMEIHRPRQEKGGRGMARVLHAAYLCCMLGASFHGGEHSPNTRAAKE